MKKARYITTNKEDNQSNKSKTPKNNQNS